MLYREKAADRYSNKTFFKLKWNANKNSRIVRIELNTSKFFHTEKKKAGVRQTSQAEDLSHSSLD